MRHSGCDICIIGRNSNSSIKSSPCGGIGSPVRSGTTRITPDVMNLQAVITVTPGHAQIAGITLIAGIINVPAAYLIRIIRE